MRAIRKGTVSVVKMRTSTRILSELNSERGHYALLDWRRAPGHRIGTVPGGRRDRGHKGPTPLPIEYLDTGESLTLPKRSLRDTEVR